MRPTAKDAYNQQNREQTQARTPHEAETPCASFFQPLPDPWDVETWDNAHCSRGCTARGFSD